MKTFISTVLLSVLLASSGCFTSENVPENTIESTVQWLDELQVSTDTGDYPAAYDLVQKIEKKGSVTSHRMIDYLLVKAKAEIETGHFEEARSTLELLEQGISEMLPVYLLRGELALKQGDSVGARQQFTLAKQLNPSVKTPDL